MTNTQLIYASTADETLTIDDVKAIVDGANNNNKKASVTGFLAVNSKYFLQCLEGDKHDIDRLFQTISRDSRHREVTLLRHAECDTPAFQRWNMGVILNVDCHEEILKKHNRSGRFEPYSLNADNSLQLLIDFSHRYNTTE